MNDTILCFKQTSGILICNGTEYDIHNPPLTVNDAYFWVYFSIYVGLTLGAGLMSGLTLGLLSLDTLTLEVLMKAGYGKEAMYAEKLYPIIKNHHILLVTLLLGNAACVESMPIFLDRISDPVTAIIVSVTAVLIFGEIIPQALCKRYGLAIGYYMRPLVYVIMGLSLIISYPISKLLDCIFGHDSGTYYQRSQLKALIDLHGPSQIQFKMNDTDEIDQEKPTENNDSDPQQKLIKTESETKALNNTLSLEEVTIIKGALDLTMMTAENALVPLDQVFMLSDEMELDESTMKKIVQNAHSRIPVYCGKERRLVRGILITKMLIQLDPSDHVPIKSITKDPNCFRKLSYVTETTPLYDLLQLFKTGRTGHMAVVVKDSIGEEEVDALERFYACNEQDLVTVFPPVTGIITLEDVLERLIQSQIQDEGDIQREQNVSRRVLEKQKFRRARSYVNVSGRRSRSNSRGLQESSGQNRKFKSDSKFRGYQSIGDNRRGSLSAAEQDPQETRKTAPVNSTSDIRSQTGNSNGYQTFQHV